MFIDKNVIGLLGVTKENVFRKRCMNFRSGDGVETKGGAKACETNVSFNRKRSLLLQFDIQVPRSFQNFQRTLFVGDV